VRQSRCACAGNPFVKTRDLSNRACIDGKTLVLAPPNPRTPRNDPELEGIRDSSSVLGNRGSIPDRHRDVSINLVVAIPRNCNNSNENDVRVVVLDSDLE